MIKYFQQQIDILEAKKNIEMLCCFDEKVKFKFKIANK